MTLDIAPEVATIPGARAVAQHDLPAELCRPDFAMRMLGKPALTAPLLCGFNYWPQPTERWHARQYVPINYDLVYVLAGDGSYRDEHDLSYP